MKTLILTCVSCILLAGVYLTLTHKSAVSQLLLMTKTPAAAMAALPVSAQEEMAPVINLDAETSPPPVETLPTQNNTVPVINATAVEEVAVPDVADSNWIDYSVFQKEADAVASAFAQVTDIDASTLVIEPEKEENSIVHVPFLEEEVEGPALESRQLIMNLNPET